MRELIISMVSFLMDLNSADASAQIDKRADQQDGDCPDDGLGKDGNDVSDTYDC